MNLPGFRLHQLSGQLRGYYAVSLWQARTHAASIEVEQFVATA